MAMELDALLKTITHKTDHTSDLISAELGNSVTGARVLAKTERAGLFAKLEDDLFAGRRSGGSIDIIDKIEGLQELKETLAEAGGSSGLKRLTEGKQRELNKLAKNVYRDSANAIAELEAAKAATHDQFVRVERQLESQIKLATKELDKAASVPGTTPEAIREMRQTFNSNVKSARESLVTHFKDIREARTDVIDKLKTIVADVEKETGVASAEFMSKAAAAAEKGVAKEAGVAEKEVAQVAKNSHVAGAALGAAVGGALGYMTTEDPNNKTTNAAVGAGAGGLLGYVASVIFKGMQTAKNGVGAVAQLSHHPELSSLAKSAAHGMHIG